mgnify:FL=1
MGGGGKSVKDLERFDEVAEGDYDCERHQKFVISSPHDAKVHERRDCPFAPTKTRKGETVVRIVAWAKVWRFHPECVYENLRELDPETGEAEKPT